MDAPGPVPVEGSLEAEIVALRQQLNVLRRSAPKRPALKTFDRFIAKYMARHRRPPSQGWRTFLLNHADGIASTDLFVVPTISFRLLYGLLVLRHDRRRILWVGVTAHPTAEWIVRQVTEACGWECVPQYLIGDRHHVYSEAFTRRIRAMGIRDRPTSATIALAERLCRTSDRLDQTRVP